MSAKLALKNENEKEGKKKKNAQTQTELINRNSREAKYVK